MWFRQVSPFETKMIFFMLVTHIFFLYQAHAKVTHRNAWQKSKREFCMRRSSPNNYSKTMSNTKSCAMSVDNFIESTWSDDPIFAAPPFGKLLNPELTKLRDFSGTLTVLYNNSSRDRPVSTIIFTGVLRSLTENMVKVSPTKLKITKVSQHDT